MSAEMANSDIWFRLWEQIKIHENDIPEMADLLRDAGKEISCLRAVVKALNASFGPLGSRPWMKHSPAEDAFARALGSGSSGRDD